MKKKSNVKQCKSKSKVRDNNNNKEKIQNNLDEEYEDCLGNKIIKNNNINNGNEDERKTQKYSKYNRKISNSPSKSCSKSSESSSVSLTVSSSNNSLENKEKYKKSYKKQIRQIEKVKNISKKVKNTEKINIVAKTQKKTYKKHKTYLINERKKKTFKKRVDNSSESNSDNNENNDKYDDDDDEVEDGYEDLLSQKTGTSDYSDGNASDGDFEFRKNNPNINLLNQNQTQLKWDIIPDLSNYNQELKLDDETFPMPKVRPQDKYVEYDPSEIFKLYFTNELINHIVDSTNEHLTNERKKLKLIIIRKDRTTSYNDITPDEYRVFLGMKIFFNFLNTVKRRGKIK